MGKTYKRNQEFKPKKYGKVFVKNPSTKKKHKIKQHNYEDNNVDDFIE